MREYTVKKGLKDAPTTQSVLAQFAKLILDRMGNDLKSFDRKCLQGIVSGEVQERHHVFVELQRVDGRAICSLYVDIRGNDRYESRYARDAETQDDYVVYDGDDISVKFSWPSHGTDSLAMNLVRLRLYQDVAALAQELEATAKYTREFVSLARTAAERAEAKTRAETARIEKAIKAVLAEKRKNMRVGAEQSICVLGVPAGWYEVSFDDNKQYRVVLPESAEDGNAPAFGTFIRAT